MKNIYLLFLLLSTFTFGQVPAYYSSVDFNQSGASVRSQLASLITTTHNPITYTEVWGVLQVSDLETGSTTMVTLVYGYNDGDGNVVTDRTRDKNANGGNNGDWNREHIFAKSLGNPDLGTSGPGADAHNLRACDVQQNNNRSSKKYADGSGNTGDVGANWYPGDEWKGDCARIVMYMYLRYGNQCIPSAVGVGTTNSVDANMVDLFLDWNFEDPVSQFEKDRNDAIQNSQGNRNPFIDNPRIATKIWGGPLAEETWGVVGMNESIAEDILVYPTIVKNGLLHISGLNTLEKGHISVVDLQGKTVQYMDLESSPDSNVHLDDLESGMYILQLELQHSTVTQKFIIQ